MVSVPLALRLVGLRGSAGPLGMGCLLMMILDGWIRLIRVVMLRFSTCVWQVLTTSSMFSSFLDSNSFLDERRQPSHNHVK